MLRGNFFFHWLIICLELSDEPSSTQMISIYFSKKISLLLTEKIFKNQIIEFYNILKQYNKEKISKLNETN